MYFPKQHYESRVLEKSGIKDRPGCLFTRTFLLKSSYTLLHMLECLKLHASPIYQV